MARPSHLYRDGQKGTYGDVLGEGYPQEHVRARAERVPMGTYAGLARRGQVSAQSQRGIVRILEHARPHELAERRGRVGDFVTQRLDLTAGPQKLAIPGVLVQRAPSIR